MQAENKPLMTDPQVEEAARLFAILSEPSRLKLLRTLMEKPMNVSELMAATKMKQGNVSKHLGVLLGVRFVAREREGNFARYSLADPRLPQLCSLMCARIEDDLRQRIDELSR